jgi:unsaturated rhamnogalacturonyl hydrolase
MLLLDAYESTGDGRYLERAQALAAHMLALPHDDATGAAFHRPQHPDYHDYLYVDCMEVDAPFLCKLGKVTGDDAFTGAGVAQMLGYCALLQDDETGLFYHQYDRATGQVNGAFWGRGNGWALLGMLKTLRLLPESNPAHAAIMARFVQLVSALDCWQRPDGTWSTVINATETYRECSLPAMFGAGIGLGIRYGLLDASFAPVVERAWRATSKRITDGLLRDVSIATPPGDAAHYDQIATGSGYPWGQGPALLFALMQG